MEQFNGLSAEHQAIAGLAFLIALGVFGAWARIFGKKEGPAKPEVKEFALTGQFADMSAVKELVEQAGLVFQQMVRTNMLHEKDIDLRAKAVEQSTEIVRSLVEQQADTAKALHRLAVAYEAHIADEQREREIEEEVERRVRERGK